MKLYFSFEVLTNVVSGCMSFSFTVRFVLLLQAMASADAMANVNSSLTLILFCYDVYY